MLSTEFDNILLIVGEAGHGLPPGKDCVPRDPCSEQQCADDCLKMGYPPGKSTCSQKDQCCCDW